jgi:DNA-binding MarR family transcriptional regulator
VKETRYHGRKKPETRTSRLANILGAIAISLNDQLVGSSGFATLEPPVDHMTAGSAISLLRWMPGLPMQRLATCLGLSQSATVRLVDRLSTAGLVERRREADGHQVHVFLTPNGSAAATRIHRTRARVLERLVTRLQPEDQDQLLRISERLAAQLPNDQWHAMHVCRLCHFRSCGDDDDCPVWDSVRDRPDSES